jgi:hypothetical protein
MNRIKSTFLLRSFTYNVGSSPSQDNWVIGNYNTPIELNKGDCFFLVGWSVGIQFASVGGAGRLDIQDAGNNYICSLEGGANVNVMPANSYLNFPVILYNPAFSPLRGLQTFQVQQTGLMQIVISGATFTAGTGRYDFGVIRQY